MGTRVLYDLAGQDFFDSPYPSDARLKDGAPDLSKFPNPLQLQIVSDFVKIAQQRKGFPVLPVGFFHFDGPIAPRDLSAVIPADRSQPILLVDVDPASPERGSLTPLVATVPPADTYVPDNLLAVAPRPGFVLAPKRTYAFVIQKSLNDASGRPLLVSKNFEVSSNKSLADTLAMIGVDPKNVAVATTFTTGDVVEDTFDLTTGILKKTKITIENLALVPNNDQQNTRFCRIAGEVSYPQFQRGMPPFDKEGLFELGADGLPIEQRKEKSPVVITLPKTAMPAGGFPLIVYFHGSGGRASQLADGAGSGADPMPLAQWPAHVNAEHGFAMAATAMPVSPDRLPGAEDTAYLNLSNPTAMRDTFRQGIIEQRLFIEALRTLVIPPSAVAGCAGISLPQGESAYRFDEAKLAAQGQSMGGMYTNLIGAVEPRIREVVPTGAGGFWTYFILETTLIPNAQGLLSVALGSRAKLSFVHPVLHVIETGWEPADPIVSVPRLARRPLENHPARPIYEPVGKGDSYFPTTVYDAMAIAYGNKQAGEIVWPSMQQALSLAGRGGLVAYPVSVDPKANGIVVQYAGDGTFDPHAIYRVLDAVKYQYGCFHETFARTGTAIVAEPRPLGTPCP